MVTYVEVEGLLVHARHGVDPVEQVVGNDFRLDMRLDYDASRAMAYDTMVSGLNYATVVEIAKREMAVPSCLLEHVVARIHTALMAEMPAITGGRIRLAKLKPPISAQLTACAFVLEW